MYTSIVIYIDRLPYNLYCVGGDVKHCKLTHSLIYIVAPALWPALALGTTYRLMSPQHHLCLPSENN